MAFDYKIHFLVQIDVGYFLFILPFYFLLNRPPARPSYVDIYNITHAESLDQSVNWRIVLHLNPSVCMRNTKDKVRARL